MKNFLWQTTKFFEAPNDGSGQTPEVKEWQGEVEELKAAIAILTEKLSAGEASSGETSQSLRAEMETLKSELAEAKAELAEAKKEAAKRAKSQSSTPPKSEAENPTQKKPDLQEKPYKRSRGAWI